MICLWIKAFVIDSWASYWYWCGLFSVSTAASETEWTSGCSWQWGRRWRHQWDSVCVRDCDSLSHSWGGTWAQASMQDSAQHKEAWRWASVCCISACRIQSFACLSKRYFRCHYHFANLASDYFTVHDVARYQERSLLVTNNRPFSIINRPEAPVPVITEEPAMPGVHVLPLFFFFGCVFFYVTVA